MAVDPISEALKIKPLITDDMFNTYMGLDKDTQKSFLNSLEQDELINMQLRLSNQFNVPDDQFETAFSSARRDFMTGGTSTRFCSRNIRWYARKRFRLFWVTQ